MKTIIFIRHAKSSWEKPISDVDRPLNERGYNDAHHVAEKLTIKKLNIDRVHSSIAKRAKDTANIIAFKLGFKNTDIDYSEKLYDFEGGQVMDYIRSLPDNQNNVIIFGHNPAFTAIINTLGTIKFDNLPTCGVVCIKFNIEIWKEIADGDTEFYILPKLLGYR